jgi:hypothetical protein
VRQTLALLALAVALTLVDCGAEGNDGQAPITTVEGPLEIETQGRDELHEEDKGEADGEEDGEGDEDGRGKDKEKKGKARGHDKGDEN